MLRRSPPLPSCERKPAAEADVSSAALDHKLAKEGESSCMCLGEVGGENHVVYQMLMEIHRSLLLWAGKLTAWQDTPRQ